jgi:hypothetical protein
VDVSQSNKELRGALAQMFVMPAQSMKTCRYGESAAPQAHAHHRKNGNSRRRQLVRRSSHRDEVSIVVRIEFTSIHLYDWTTLCGMARSGGCQLAAEQLRRGRSKIWGFFLNFVRLTPHNLCIEIVPAAVKTCYAEKSLAAGMECLFLTLPST